MNSGPLNPNPKPNTQHQVESLSIDNHNPPILVLTVLYSPHYLNSGVWGGFQGDLALNPNA